MKKFLRTVYYNSKVVLLDVRPSHAKRLIEIVVFFVFAIQMRSLIEYQKRQQIKKGCQVQSRLENFIIARDESN